MKYNLIQGNCLELMKNNISDNSIDLIVTDPPYKTITGGDLNGKSSIRPKGMLKGNRKLFRYQNIEISDWMSELYRVLKDNSHCYIFTNSLNMQEMLNEATSIGFKLHNILVWVKNNCTPSQFYMKNCEYVLFLRKGIQIGKVKGFEFRCANSIMWVHFEGDTPTSSIAFHLSEIGKTVFHTKQDAETALKTMKEE